MTAPDTQESGWRRLLRAALPQKRCPHCRSRLPFDVGHICPRCDRPLSGEGGEQVRPIDADYEGLLRANDRRAGKRVLWGAALALLISLLTLFPPVALFVGPALGILQMVWIRWFIAGMYRRHFSTSRRIVTRWVARFGLGAGAGFHLPVAFLFPISLAAAPALFAALSAIAWGYHRWHFAREHARLPVHPLEKVLLWVAGIVFVLALTLAVLLVLLIQGMLESFSG